MAVSRSCHPCRRAALASVIPRFAVRPGSEAVIQPGPYPGRRRRLQPAQRAVPHQGHRRLHRPDAAIRLRGLIVRRPARRGGGPLAGGLAGSWSAGVDLASAGADHIPSGAERLGPLSMGGPGAAVAGEVVQRVAVVGDLQGPVWPFDRPQQGLVDAATPWGVPVTVSGGHAAAHAPETTRAGGPAALCAAPEAPARMGALP